MVSSPVSSVLPNAGCPTEVQFQLAEEGQTKFIVANLWLPFPPCVGDHLELLPNEVNALSLPTHKFIVIERNILSAQSQSIYAKRQLAAIPNVRIVVSTSPIPEFPDIQTAIRATGLKIEESAVGDWRYSWQGIANSASGFASETAALEAALKEVEQQILHLQGGR